MNRVTSYSFISAVLICVLCFFNTASAQVSDAPGPPLPENSSSGSDQNPLKNSPDDKTKKKKEQKTQKNAQSPNAPAANPAPQPAPSGPFPVGVAPPKQKAAPQVETIVNNTGILIPKGKLLVQNTFEYIHNSATQVALQGFTVIPAILIGSINVESVSQEMYMDILTFYYGITNNLELEVDVPYVYRTESVLSYPVSGGSGNLIQTGTSGNGLGDIQFGFHDQLNQTPWGGFFFLASAIAKANNGSNPFTIPTDSNTNLLVAQPTGSGFWSIEPSLTAIFPSDPVVFYANAAYIYNFSSNFGSKIGVINPGNATDLSFGAGFSLNDKTSFDVGYDQMTMWPPTQNGVQIPLSQVLQMGSLVFGYSYNVSQYFFYLLNVEVGVTPDAPNIQLSFRFPLYF